MTRERMPSQIMPARFLVILWKIYLTGGEGNYGGGNAPGYGGTMYPRDYFIKINNIGHLVSFSDLRSKYSVNAISRTCRTNNFFLKAYSFNLEIFSERT